MVLTDAQKKEADAIRQLLVDQARVKRENGKLVKSSMEFEAAFEANERGFGEAAVEMGRYAARML